MSQRTWKSHLLTFLKLALPVAIIWWLLSRIEPEDLETLRSRPKNWTLLGAAFLFAFAAVTFTFVRWWLLVRTLGLTFRLRDALRLGFLCYLLNFVSAGSLGGDLFKAVFIAREQPGRRGEAVASVLVDRLVGFLAMLMVASLAILFMGIPDHPVIRAVCHTTLIGTVVGFVGLGVLMLPTLTQGTISRWASELPLVGNIAAKIIAGVRLYKSKPLTLVLIGMTGVATHLCFTLSMYMIAKSMYQLVPSFADHLAMVPLAMIANAVPLTPGGLGTMEAALHELYRLMPEAPHEVKGVLVALVFRLTTIAIAGVGAIFYIRSRAELEKVKKEV